MSNTPPDRATVERRLWSEIEHDRTGMLGLTAGAPRHFQPMTAFVEADAGDIWFFTRKDTELASALDGDGEAMFVFQSKDLQACIGGRLSLAHDRVRMDKYWNAVVAAWYPDGKDDPMLTMLRFRATDAEVWLSEAGPLRFAWEIAKANASKTTPDVGDHQSLNFH